MPAVITHQIFGEEVHQLPVVDPSFPSVFNWGAQGPDIFLFTLPLSSDARRLIRVGISLHCGLVEKNLALMADCCRKAEGIEKAALTSYLYGYLAHYILDSTMHPFVYGIQRYFKALLPAASDNYLHRTIETNLDIIFLNKLRGMTIKDYSVSGRLKLRPELDFICRMFSRLMYDNYGIGIESERIRKSFSSMRSVYAFLYSPAGIKRGAIGAVEHIIGHRYPEYAALSHTVKASDKIDFANIDKAIIDEGSDALKHDAFELFETAKQRYETAAEKLRQILLDGGDFDDITNGLNFKGEREEDKSAGGQVMQTL